MNIDNDIRALILRELTAIREATIRRCGRTKPGRAERKVLAAVRRIEEVVR